MYPNYPEVEVNCKSTAAGVECTASTRFNGIDLSATITETTKELAERRAKTALERKRRMYI